ncbi:MAG: squalene/phytoene synthase family protein [Sulfurifustaceae bacterium]
MLQRVSPTDPLPHPTTVSTTTLASAQGPDAVAVCERKLADANLGRYFSVLFLPPPQRAALAALYAFWEEVREIRDECTEADVARIKLAWWHEELDEIFAGRPRHPVSVALLPIIREFHLPAQTFFDILEALAGPIVRPQFAAYAGLLDYGRRSRGTLEELAAHVTTGTPAPSAIAAIGARLELVALLQRAGADARRERCYLPEEDCARFGVAVAELSAVTPGAQALMQFEAERLERELRENLTEAAERQAPLAIAARLALAVLGRIRTQPKVALRDGVSITPLRQLWIAWRTAHRSRRR